MVRSEAESTGLDASNVTGFLSFQEMREIRQKRIEKVFCIAKL